MAHGQSRSNAFISVASASAFLFACAYGLLLSSIPFDGIKDRANYLTYAESSDVIFAGRLSQGFLALVVNEPVWLLANLSLGLFLDATLTVKIFVGVPAAMVAWVMLREAPRALPIVALFLLMPQVLNNHIIFLRQGTAIALFVFAWFRLSGAKQWIVFSLLPFVHASFFFVLPLMILVKWARQMSLGPDVRLLLVIVFGLVSGLSLASVADFLGARQADAYVFRAADVSGLGFLFWAAVLLVFLSAGRKFLANASFEVAAIVFYLSTYFLVEVTARIFESSLILVLLAGLKLKGLRKIIFVLLITAYSLLIYFSRLGQPLWGFGVEV